jgi:hypothetical protein
MSRKHAVPARSPKAKDNRDGKTTPPTSATDDLIASLCGSSEGDDSWVDGLHQERQEKSFAERRWEVGDEIPGRSARTGEGRSPT